MLTSDDLPQSHTHYRVRPAYSGSPREPRQLAFAHDPCSLSAEDLRLIDAACSCGPVAGSRYYRRRREED